MSDTISLTREEVGILLRAPNFEAYETVSKRLVAFDRSPPAPTELSFVAIVPPHCSGSVLGFEPGALHVNKDGSGYITINEDDFVLEDDRTEGPDGPEGSIHWIVRLGASEMVALRDFLTGAPAPAEQLAAEVLTVDMGAPLTAVDRLRALAGGSRDIAFEPSDADEILEKLEALAAILSAPNLEIGDAPAPAEHVVGVKPLEWKELVREDRKVEVADTILGRWEIWQFPGGGTHIMKPGEHQGTVFEDSYDEAKAHMERAYRRRIAPAISSTEVER